MGIKYSQKVAELFADVSSDYHIDGEGHWITLKSGYHRRSRGGRIIHEKTIGAMLKAREDVEKDS